MTPVRSEGSPRGERGSALFVTMSLIVSVLYLSLLVIDITRAKYAVNTMQRAVDAASLAAVAELVLSSHTDSERWVDAKRVALGVLKANPLFMSGSLPDPSDSATHRGDPDPCETDTTSPYRWQTYESSQVRIEVVRGSFDDSSNSFTSLENSAVCADNTGPNAVQITVTVIGFRTIFGGVPPFQMVEMPPLTRTGLGVQL